jgi:hypothetical protein
LSERCAVAFLVRVDGAHQLRHCGLGLCARRVVVVQGLSF